MDYELIDAGNSKKLERFGQVYLIRPEVNAYFKPGQSMRDWYQKAHFEFHEHSDKKGQWEQLQNIDFGQWVFDSTLGFKMNLSLSRFKHVGVFPEQYRHWKYIQQNIKQQDQFLNLFAYTGAASLAAAVNNAKVTHVDSVKRVITDARSNMQLSQISDIRWIADDAFTFIKREKKRGRSYQGMIIDPPSFGIGKNKKRWKLKDQLPELLKTAYQCLDKNGFMIMNIYSDAIKVEELKMLAQEIITKHSISVFPLEQKSKTGKRLLHNEVLQITPK